MMAEPVAIPLIKPVEAPIGATVDRLLCHEPPGDASVNVIVPPTHNTDGPAMAAGNASTVTVNVAAQPPAKV